MAILQEMLPNICFGLTAKTKYHIGYRYLLTLAQQRLRKSYIGISSSFNPLRKSVGQNDRSYFAETNNTRCTLHFHWNPCVGYFRQRANSLTRFLEKGLGVQRRSPIRKNTFARSGIEVNLFSTTKAAIRSR